MNFNIKKNKKPAIKKGIFLGIPFLCFLITICLFSFGFLEFFVMESAFFMDSLTIDTEDQILFDKLDPLSIHGDVFPPIRFGTQYATLSIPSINLEKAPIIHGDNPTILRRGIGHFQGSRFPGQNGNVVLDGHANAIFKNLYKVKAGDEVLMDTAYGEYIYEVEETVIFDYNDNTYIYPADGIERLTVYTCYPPSNGGLGFKTDRFAILCKKTSGRTWPSQYE